MPEPKPWDQREQITLLPGGVAVVPCRGMLCAGLDAITAWYWDICRPGCHARRSCQGNGVCARVPRRMPLEEAA